MAKWICRHCAAHVNEEMLECPCCAAPAPARLVPELSNRVATEIREAPHSKQIHWLSLKSLPDVRKQAQSPWVWALLGFVIGLGYATIQFHGSLAQPFLTGTALAVVFWLLGVLLRRRRRLNEGRIHPSEIGALLGFFLPIILFVLDAFANRRGWEKPLTLFGGFVLVAGGSLLLAAFGAIASGAIAPIGQAIARALGWRSDRSNSRGLRADSPRAEEGGAFEDLCSESKKPFAWLPSFEARNIHKGAESLSFRAWLVGLLIVAVMILALLASMGISTPASDWLAMLFSLIIWIVAIGSLLWSAFVGLPRLIAGAARKETENAEIEENPDDTVLSSDAANLHAIQTGNDSAHLAQDDHKDEFDIKADDAETR